MAPPLPLKHIFPENIIELKLALTDKNMEQYPYALSSAQMISKMDNLESLFIQWDLTKKYLNLGKFVDQSLQAFGSCRKLKELNVHINSKGVLGRRVPERVELSQIKEFCSFTVSSFPTNKLNPSRNALRMTVTNFCTVNISFI